MSVCQNKSKIAQQYEVALLNFFKFMLIKLTQIDACFICGVASCALQRIIKHTRATSRTPFFSHSNYGSTPN